MSAFGTKRTLGAGSACYFFIVIVIRDETTAATPWTLLLIVRTLFNDTITVAVWTGFHVRLPALRPIREITERLEINCSIPVQRFLQLGCRVAEYQKALALHHILKWLSKFLRKYSQVSKRCGGICVSFVNVNCLAVLAYKPLVAENTRLAPRRLNHLACQRSETLRLARLDH